MYIRRWVTHLSGTFRAARTRLHERIEAANREANDHYRRTATAGQVEPDRPVHPPRRPAGSKPPRHGGPDRLRPGSPPADTFANLARHIASGDADPFAIATVLLPVGGQLVLNRVEVVDGQDRAHITLNGAGTAHAWIQTEDLVTIHEAAGKAHRGA